MLVVFDLHNGTLVLTEASAKKHCALHFSEGAAALAKHDPGGLKVLQSDRGAFRLALLREDHTLTLALADAHLFSGFGNAYSDEIVHAARLSPFTASSAVPVPSASARSGAFGKRTMKPITAPGAILKVRFSLIACFHVCSSRIGPSQRTTWHDVAKPLKCIMETSVAALKAPVTTICRQLTLPSTRTDKIKIPISNSSSTSPMSSETATRR